MKIKITINEVKSWADKEKVRQAKEELDSGSEDRTARDSLKRDVKRKVGTNLEKIQPLLNIVTQRKFTSVLSDFIIDFFHENDLMNVEDLNIFLPRVLKLSIDNKEHKLHAAFMLAFKIGKKRGLLNKTTMDILRKYVSIPISAYYFACNIDEKYHPTTWRNVRTSRLYRTQYINYFGSQIPREEIERLD